MKPMTLVGLRVPKTLIDDIDRLRDRWEQAVPGVVVTRSDIMRILLRAGMKHPDSQPPSGPLADA